MKFQASKQGFTIVELLIVIVVIAILAAISIVAYTGIQDRARNSSAQQLASQVAGKARAYYAIEGSWPSSLSDFGKAGASESDLEGANVIVGTTAPSSGVNQTAFQNGTLVVYDSTGPSVIYRDGSSGTDSIDL